MAAARKWVADNPRIATVLLNVLIGLAYWGLAELVLRPVSWSSGNSMTPIWPSAGLAVAATWFWGYRVLPGIYLGAVAVVAGFVPIHVAVLAAAGTAIECVIDVRLLKFFKFDDRLERSIDPLILAFGVAPVGAIVSSGLGLSAIALFGGLSFDLAFQLLLWFLRDWLGVMIVGALIFSWVRARPIVWTWQRIAEGVALGLVICLGAQLIFGLWGIFAKVPVAFIFFPMVMWAALRFGTRGASTLLAIMTIFATLIAAYGVGPFGLFSTEFAQVLLFAFLALGSLSGQLLAAIMAERDEALARRLVLEEQLRHSQKMEAVGRLAGGIAHDFNNLLTAIIGYTEIVLTSLDPKDERRADAEEIGRAAMRAADLTRQMLAFSRRQVLQPKVIDLNIALEQGGADAAPRDRRGHRDDRHGPRPRTRGCASTPARSSR